MITAIIGGAVGTVLGFIIGQANRLLESRSEVRLHDRQAAERNEQLQIWVDDTTQHLVRDILRVTEVDNSNGILHSSIHLGNVAGLKADALHRYRDERVSAEQYIAALRDSEGLWHRRWRARMKLPQPRLTATADVEPFLDRWREPVTVNGMADAAAHVFDRTTRTLADALDELPTLNLT